jgi:hypothetical protein
MKKIIYLLSGLIFIAMPQTNFPQAEISNGVITAKLYLPDSKTGYYQGTRFDWSGNMPSLVVNGHEYFGQWFKTYSPEIHDVIMGPVEEFTALDYPQTKPGGSFVKIGVGVLTKPDDQPYAFSRLYPMVNRGEWTVEKKSDQVKFIHSLKDKEYAYHYEKTVQLIKGKPELLLAHTLKNTGTKTIETSAYDHNFFVIDHQPVGPGYKVILPFKIKTEGQGLGVLADIKENELVFLRNFGTDETIFLTNIAGFGPTSADYDIKIENLTTRAGVRIICDQPFLKLNFWSCATTVCPEPYISLKVEPGKQITWNIRYEFYNLPD